MRKHPSHLGMQFKTFYTSCVHLHKFSASDATAVLAVSLFYTQAMLEGLAECN